MSDVSFDGPVLVETEQLPQRTLVGLAAIPAAAVVGAAAALGLLIALGGASHSWGTAFCATALLAPLAFAAWRLGSSSGALTTLIVAAAFAFFFVPRLVTFRDTGVVLKAAGLTPQEVRRGTADVRLALLFFALPLAACFAFVRRAPRPTLVSSADARHGVRVSAAITFGLFGSIAAVTIGLRQGVNARELVSGSGGNLFALLGGAADPMSGALWMAGRKAPSLVIVLMSASGAYLIGGRQAIIGPFIILAFAMASRAVADARLGGRGVARQFALIGTLGAVALIVVALATATKRGDSARAWHGGETPTLMQSLVEDQSLLEPLYVGMVREDRPQGFAIYERALAAPIPRALWPAKPLSYDFDFRARWFPEWGGGIPISFVGTAYLSFLLPGVFVAGALVGAIALLGERLFCRGRPREVLLAAIVTLFAVDLIRIGGLYREVLTFTILCMVTLCVTRVRSAADDSGEGI